jgi:hypothetical protein
VFSPSNKEILVVLLLLERGCNSLLYLPVDVAQLGEPRKFLCVSFLILSYSLLFILSGLHASILTITTENFYEYKTNKQNHDEDENIMSVF